MKIDQKQSKAWATVDHNPLLEKKNFQRKIIRNHKIIGVLTLFLSLSLNAQVEATGNPKEKSIYHLLQESELTKDYIDVLSIIKNGEKYMIEEMEKKKHIKQIFKHYCDVYQIDDQIAYEIASTRTNNFTDPEYLATNRIPGTAIYQQTKSFSTKELGYLVYIRALSQQPSLFGVKTDDIRTNSTGQLETSTPKMIENYCAMTGLDPYLMFAIMEHETQNFTSSLYQNHNNPGGIRNPTTHQFNHYPNMEQGIIENILLLSYCPTYQNINSIKTIEKLREVYCPSSEAGNELWLIDVQDKYQKAKQNQIFASQPSKVKTYIR